MRGWDFAASKRPTCSGIPPGLPKHRPGPCSGEDLTLHKFTDGSGSCSASEKTGRASVLGDEETEAASHLEIREGFDHRGGGLCSLSFPWKAEGLGKGGPCFSTSSKTSAGRGSQGRLQPRHSWADPQGFTCALVNASLVILLFCREDVMYGRTDYALHNTKSCAA